MAQPIKYQGVDKESSGYKLLAAMGWQEGCGLGARQQGIKEHVKVKKKHDSTGVGAIEAITKARDWTAGMAAYDLVLAKMKSVGAATLPDEPQTKPRKSKKKRKQPEDPSDLSVPVANVDTVTQEPEGIRNSKSSKKSKKDNSASAKDANAVSPAVSPSISLPQVTVASAVAAQDVLETRPQAVRARGRHIGRYHKSAAAKKAGSYSQSDLAAILGVDSLPAAAPAAITVAAVTEPVSSDAQDSSEDTTFQPRHSVAEQGSEGQSMEAGTAEEQEERKAQDGSLWWHGMFVKAGRMGNMAAEVQAGSKPEVKINGFSEQDQENLYNVTQAGKSAGKKGLGKSSQGKPIGGAKWEGTKTVLGEEDEQAAVLPEPVKEGSQAQGSQVDARTPKIKWKKLAKRAITAAGGKMKIKKLQKQLLQEIELPPHQHAVAAEQLMLQLASSKQFAVAGSSVSATVPCS